MKLLHVLLAASLVVAQGRQSEKRRKRVRGRKASKLRATEEAQALRDAKLSVEEEPEFVKAHDSLFSRWIESWNNDQI